MRGAVIAAAFLVSACASDPKPVSVLPIQPVDPVVTPVAFEDLRGKSVMVLDRTDPQIAVRRMTTYLRQCKTDGGERIAFDPSGLRLVGPNNANRLTLMVAQRGPVTGVALDGPDLTPVLQEELAQAVEGASSCTKI